MNDYTPTYLYIKKHNITGLLYFGKTNKSDIIGYLGSGKRWQRHLKKHGKDITTIWYELFDDRDSLTEFAKFFSEFHDIVESKSWANLIPENGINGGSAPGRKYSAESRCKMSNSAKLRKSSQETKDKISKALKGKIVSKETRAKLSIANQNMSDETRVKIANSWSEARRAEMSVLSVARNAARLPITCPHCGTVGLHAGLMKKYHFDNCFMIVGNDIGIPFLSPDGEIIKISNFNAYGRLLGISGERLRLVGTGQMHQYKGWKLYQSLPNEPIKSSHLD